LGKNRWVAALGNLLVWGLGYVYLNERRGLGIILLSAFVASTAALIWSLVFPLPRPIWPYVDLNGTGHGLVGIALGYDAYQLARRIESITPAQLVRDEAYAAILGFIEVITMMRYILMQYVSATGPVEDWFFYALLLICIALLGMIIQGRMKKSRGTVSS
jgi:xanthosine utilization system XapX-like protein